MMGTHARLSPSNQRWPICAGSVREEAGYEDIAGMAAIDGTGSHLLLEMCLENAVPAIVYDGQIIGSNHEDNPNGWLVAPDRVDRVQVCLDYISRRHRELKEMYPRSTIMVEQESKSDVGFYFNRDDWYGTCDVTITCRDSHTGEVLFLEVIDYKDGRGWVHVPDNTQLLAYLGGKMGMYDKVKDIRMTIVQPKVSKPIRYQCSIETKDIDVKKVSSKLEMLALAAEATDDPNAPVVSGKHCQWCKANPKRGGHCTAATEESIKTVTTMSEQQLTLIPTGQGDFFELVKQVTADPKQLTSTQLGEMLDAKDAFLTAFDKCSEELESRVKAGEKVSGWAMREGRGANVWNLPEDEIEKKLKAKRLKLVDIYPKKLISPAQVLKIKDLTQAQKDNIQEELISFKAGKLKLTKVAHNDTKVIQSVTDMFAEVEEPAKIDFF